MTLVDAITILYAGSLVGLLLLAGERLLQWHIDRQVRLRESHINRIVRRLEERGVIERLVATEARLVVIEAQPEAGDPCLN